MGRARPAYSDGIRALGACGCIWVLVLISDRPFLLVTNKKSQQIESPNISFSQGKDTDTLTYNRLLDKLFSLVMIPENILPSSLTQLYDNILLIDNFERIVIVLPNRLDLGTMSTSLCKMDSSEVKDSRHNSRYDDFSSVIPEIRVTVSLCLAIIVAKVKEIQKNRFPTPSIVFCIDGDSESRYYTHFCAPSHKDPEEFQNALFPFLQTYFSKEEVSAIILKAKEKFWYNNDKPGFVAILYTLFAALKTRKQLLC